MLQPSNGLANLATWLLASPGSLWMHEAHTKASGAPSRAPCPDADLIARAVRGNRQAYDDLYRRHVDGVWRKLTHLVGADPEREDLTQQIFVDVFRSLDRFRGEATFSTFLYRVTVNTAYDHLKRRVRAPLPECGEYFATLSAPGATPESEAETRQRLALTWSLLDKIAPKKRVAFLLRTVEGLSLDEIAQQTDSNVAAVAKRIKHAHDELQSMLQKRQGRA